MKILDPGHSYELDTYDGEGYQALVFVKRDDPAEKYPGNVGHHPGTNIQEVLRVLIDRLDYLDDQVPCDENRLTRQLLVNGIYWLEVRAHRRHGHELAITTPNVEDFPVCRVCGHLVCKTCHADCERKT